MRKEVGRIALPGKKERVVYANLEPDIPEEQIIRCPDKKEVKVDWRRNFDRIESIREVIKEAELVQLEGTYRVQLDRPDIKYGIGLIFSDLHIGSWTSDHNLIREVLNLVSEVPNCIIIDAGDAFDNGVWGGLSYEQALPPYMQTFTVQDIMREFGEKFACATMGNHPEWLFTAVGQKPEHMFARKVAGPVFDGMGLLHLEAGKQKYDIAVAHNYWGKSKKNIFNCCVNFRNHEYPNADAFIIGHEHIWGHGQERVNNKIRTYIRPGTAKVDDRYARQHGIAKRGQRMGMALVFGTENKSLEAKPISEAVEIINLREEIANEIN
jgi:hypothetical protein